MEKRIPEKVYRKILENMPVCCIDLIIYHKNKVLLVYRKNEPCKDMWWIPGGRLYKTETLEEAAIRKAKEETGLEVKIEKMIGTYETIFDKGLFCDLKTGVHTVNITFLAKPINSKTKIRLDKTSSNYKWISKIEKSLHPYLKKVLKDSRVFD